MLSGSEDYLFWLKILGKQEIYGFSDTTSSLVMHESRSMSEYNGDKNKNRQEIFLDELKKDKNCLLKFNKYFNVIESSSLLLISLDYSVEKKIKKALKYLIKSLFFKRVFLDDKANLFLSLIVLQEIILDLKFFSTYLFTNNNC